MSWPIPRNGITDLLLACAENGDMPPLRVTSHCTEDMSPVTCPNFQHLQRFVCLCVGMCARTCVHVPVEVVLSLLQIFLPSYFEVF